MSHPVFAVGDGKYTVTSPYSPNEGLAPKDKSLTADNAVVDVAPNVTDPLFTWNFVRRGTTLDNKSLIATFELLGSGLFLSYDFAAKSVVIKNESHPAWIVTPYSGGQNQYTIAPLTADPIQYLTYAGEAAQVIVANPLTNPSDVPKQVWNLNLIG